MPLRAGQIIEAARIAHPAFTRAVAPTSICARLLNEVQRRLLMAAHQRNPSYLVRRWPIALLPGQDVARVGAGASQGAPLQPGAGHLTRRRVNTGSLATLAPSTILVSERAASAATATSLQDATAAWAVDAWQNREVEIVDGPGRGQVRRITSNTATTLQVTPAWESGAVPTAESTYQIREPATEAVAAVSVQMAGVPALEARQGWLVKLDALGVPYLDLAEPVEVPVTVGIPLPPNHHVLQGVVVLRGARSPAEREVLTLTSSAHQLTPPRPYCAYVEGEHLFLCGTAAQWRAVEVIEVPYLPLAPAVSRAEDLLILPDAAEEALVAGVVLGLARRGLHMGVVGQGVDLLVQRAQEMETLYLNHVAGVGRATVSQIREVW